MASRTLTIIGAAILITVPAFAAETSPTPENALTIGTRKSAAGKVWLQKSLKDDAFQADATEVAFMLAKDKLDALDKVAIVEAIERDKNRAARAFSNCLNFKKYPNVPTRMGALKGIEIATGSQHDIKNVSLRIAGLAVGSSMLAEPVKEIRSAAMDLVRNHRDDTVSEVASGMLVTYWHNAFDLDGINNEPQRDTALAALKDLGDKRTYDQLLYYATMEVHAASATQSAPPQTVFITNAGLDVNIGGGTINLPIELPSLELRSFDATLVVPAVTALHTVTGQVFNKNLDKWRNWIKEQPNFRK